MSRVPAGKSPGPTLLPARCGIRTGRNRSRRLVQYPGAKPRAEVPHEDIRPLLRGGVSGRTGPEGFAGRRRLARCGPGRCPHRTVQAGRQQKIEERIAAASEELASGITEAASAAEELRRAMEQIATGAEEAASASQETLAVATNTAATARAGSRTGGRVAAPDRRIAGNAW